MDNLARYLERNIATNMSRLWYRSNIIKKPKIKKI